MTGSLWLENCREGQPLEQEDDFDLEVDFFAGEPFPDGSDAPAQHRNSLIIRLQKTSTNIEDANGLILQLPDVAKVARHVARSELIPIASDSDALRARLYLFSRCPDCRQSLVGNNYVLGEGERPDGRPCQTTLVSPDPACPALDPQQQQVLAELCAGDFREKKLVQQIEPILGQGACLYFCTFGQAHAGQDLQQLDDFTIEFNDRVAGIFSTAIGDERTEKSGDCTQVRGRLTGMFSFEIERGRAAQSFP